MLLWWKLTQPQPNSAHYDPDVPAQNIWIKSSPLENPYLWLCSHSVFNLLIKESFGLVHKWDLHWLSQDSGKCSEKLNKCSKRKYMFVLILQLPIFVSAASEWRPHDSHFLTALLPSFSLLTCRELISLWEFCPTQCGLRQNILLYTCWEADTEQNPLDEMLSKWSVMTAGRHQIGKHTPRTTQFGGEKVAAWVLLLPMYQTQSGLGRFSSKNSTYTHTHMHTQDPVESRLVKAFSLLFLSGRAWVLKCQCLFLSALIYYFLKSINILPLLHLEDSIFIPPLQSWSEPPMQCHLIQNIFKSWPVLSLINSWHDSGGVSVGKSFLLCCHIYRDCCCLWSEAKH